jgi:hypothetical protein
MQLVATQIKPDAIASKIEMLNPSLSLELI